MTVKDQLQKIKENWLLFGLVFVVIALFFVGNTANFSSNVGVAQYGRESAKIAADYGYDEARIATSYAPSPYYGEDFAPDVQERKLTRNANLETKVKRGTFHDHENRLKSIILATDSYLLHENVNRYGEGHDGSYMGYYQLKVEDAKYDAVISQLKELGEVTSFSENTNDLTGSFVSIADQLAAEKARLVRYQQLYQEAKTTEEKLQLTDRLFNQERTIKYLEDALKNIDRQISYSTISVSLREEESAYRNIVFVKFSQLIRELVSSINNVLTLLFWAIPYAVIAGLIWFFVKVIRKGKRRK